MFSGYATDEDIIQPLPKSKLHVNFYQKARQNEQKSIDAGRPIFDMVDYVTISIPGDKTSVVDTPVEQRHMREYPLQYRAFKEERDQQSVSGTLLSAWGGMSQAEVEELAYYRIRTVEQLAEMADSAIAALGLHATAKRQRARDYIALMKGASPILEVRKENEELKRRMQMLENAMAQRDEAAAPAAEKAPAKRGRKPAAAAEIQPEEG
jgi:hypothetical protein